MAPDTQPIFRAVATSTRPIYQLLRCINFAPRVHVQITEQGIRFAADHSRVMQGLFPMACERTQILILDRRLVPGFCPLLN